MKNTFYKDIRELAYTYSRKVYTYSSNFPKSEMYGLTSQLRRSSLPVLLNFVEGYSRKSPKEYLRFLKIALGSLKESEVLIEFAQDLNYYETKKHFEELNRRVKKLGKILWTAIGTLEQKLY